MTEKYKYIVYAPPYHEDSGGAIVLHRLCHLINECGGEAYLHPHIPSFDLQHHNIAQIGPYVTMIYQASDLANYRIHQGFKTPVLRPQENFIPADDCIVVYPEIIFGNPLRARNVVRWLLHDPGQRTGQIYYGPGEIYYRYADHCSRDFEFPGSEMADICLRIQYTPVDSYREQSGHPQSERTGTAYCMKKGKGRAIVHDTADSILIDGKSHRDISRIFKLVKRFISYDPHTCLSTLAAISGCESIVVPPDNMTKEQWMPNTEDRYGVAYGFGDLEFALATRNLALERQLSLNRESQHNARIFMDHIEGTLRKRSSGTDLSQTQGNPLTHLMGEGSLDAS